MQIYKVSRDRTEAIKTIMKFKTKNKDVLKRLPQMGYMYSNGENLIVSDGSCLGAVRTSEYEKGFYELSSKGLLIPAPAEIQSMSFPETVLPMLEEIKEVELADFVCPTSFCKILEELPGTWINPEYYLKMPPGDYEIGRFRLFKSDKTDLGNCPVIFQNQTFTFIIMPLSH